MEVFQNTVDSVSESLVVVVLSVEIDGSLDDALDPLRQTRMQIVHLLAQDSRARLWPRARP